MNIRGVALGLACILSFALHAENAATPAGEPGLETPTLRSLGVFWPIKGDDNRNAVISAEYRKVGAADWRVGYPLFRIERRDKPYGDQGGKPRPPSKIAPLVPDGWLFAGSILLLDPDTEYEIKLKLHDPDGGDVEKTLKSRTIGEPAVAKDAPVKHVAPGNGGGDGSAENPFKGLDEAQKAAKPGDLMLVHAGTYKAPFTVTRNGEPGKPIVWRGAGDGEAAIDSGVDKEHVVGAPAILEMGKAHDVWIEKLTIKGGHNLIRAHDARNIVIRRCHLANGICGVFAIGDADQGHIFISDNFFEGIQPWPCTDEQWHSLPESRGVWMGGTGNVVCYNRFSHWKDGIDTADCARCDAVDFHNNDVSECFDDGTELDGSERNVRCFFNRYTNVFQGISFQPVYGGPVYAFRNTLYNCQVEPFKLHNGPSGGLVIHNTIVKNGQPNLMQTGEPVTNFVYRNNLFVGTQGRAFHFDSPMPHCDFDYDGYAGFSGDVFLKWDGVKYNTPDDVREKCPVYKHIITLDAATLFASGLKAPDSNQKVFEPAKIDLRLKEGSPAIDAGEVLPNFNDGFAGKAPDLGALEFGQEPPFYGIRPETPSK